VETDHSPHTAAFLTPTGINTNPNPTRYTATPRSHLLPLLSPPTTHIHKLRTGTHTIAFSRVNTNKPVSTPITPAATPLPDDVIHAIANNSTHTSTHPSDAFCTIPSKNTAGPYTASMTAVTIPTRLSHTLPAA
jgi:hypothetical protein